ncbi:hypothetical protein K7X08_014320 [Anisodus acutangulus]|uniref:Uncharacterized protein n=1 Tax=Anisodus acutangulus TaxID=402998 RepID=A0A9Q1LJZ7_9SOLA|nr:hypothetical protein K7X08_014320 [Anisodus acutangulus]
MNQKHKEEGRKNPKRKGRVQPTWKSKPGDATKVSQQDTNVPVETEEQGSTVEATKVDEQPATHVASDASTRGQASATKCPIDKAKMISRGKQKMDLAQQVNTEEVEHYLRRNRNAASRINPEKATRVAKGPSQAKKPP